MSVPPFGFADDIDMMGRNFEKMEASYIRLKTVSKWVGLAINTAKTN